MRAPRETRDMHERALKARAAVVDVDTSNEVPLTPTGSMTLACSISQSRLLMLCRRARMPKFTQRRRFGRAALRRRR